MCPNARELAAFSYAQSLNPKPLRHATPVKFYYDADNYHQIADVEREAAEKLAADSDRRLIRLAAERGITRVGPL